MDNYIHKILDSFIIMNTGERERERDKIEVGIKKKLPSVWPFRCVHLPPPGSTLTEDSLKL